MRNLLTPEMVVNYMHNRDGARLAPEVVPFHFKGQTVPRSQLSGYDMVNVNVQMVTLRCLGQKAKKLNGKNKL